MITIKIHEEVANAEDMVDLLNHIATMVKEGYTSGYHPGWAISGEPGIVCGCDDGDCSNKKVGSEGEIPGHIEDCSCSKCHRALGKL